MFINPDPNAAPLEEHLGEIIEQFEVWDLGNRYVEAHVSRIINANWKIAQEAFCEAYHVNATHPQILTYLGDVNSQVDVWDRCARVITPGGTPSPLLDADVSEQDMLRACSTSASTRRRRSRSRRARPPGPCSPRCHASAGGPSPATWSTR